MKIITFAGAIVLPNRDSIFLYETDTQIRSFLDNVVDANVTKKSIDHNIEKIAEKTQYKKEDIKEFSFSKTSLLMLESFEELIKKGVVNLNEIVSMSSQYEEITKLKAIKSELSSFRKTSYADTILPINVKIDGAYIIQMFIVVIYAPSDWEESNATVSLSEQQAVEQSKAIKKKEENNDVEDATSSINTTKSLASFVMLNGVGSSRSGTIEPIRQVMNIIHPFEMNVINSTISQLKKQVTNKSEILINEQNAMKYMDLKEFSGVVKEVGISNDGDRATFTNNKLSIRTSSLNEILDNDYIRRFKNDEPLKYETEAFKVTNAEALLIYAPTGSGKTEFIVENNLTLLVLDTDYSETQLNADVIITNRHELIPKYKKTCAIVYTEPDWNSLVRSKIGGDLDPVEKIWYSQMLENANKATYTIKANRGSHVDDYIVMINGTDNSRKEVVLTTKEIIHAEKKAENIKDDAQNKVSEKQEKLTKKLTAESEDSDRLTQADKTKMVDEMTTPSAIGKSTLTQEKGRKGGKNSKERMKKGTDNFMR